MGLSDPVFTRRIKEHGLSVDKAEDRQKIGELWIDQVWHGELRQTTYTPSVRFNSRNTPSRQGVVLGEDPKVCFEGPVFAKNSS